MTNKQIKEYIIQKLFERPEYIRQVSAIQFQTRCPYCGDSQKNIHTGHLYLKINPDDNLPIVYNCFKCSSKGILKYKDLELLGIEDDELKNGLSQINKTSDKYDSKNINTNNEKYFEYKLPEVKNDTKIKYVEDRLGIHFTNEMIETSRIITSLKDFLILNQINTITCKPYIARLLEEKYVGFLSNKNSHILFRDISNSEKISWFKYPITQESQSNRIFYTMKSSIDIFSTDKLYINLAEGVMDILSVVYNLGYTLDNSINIAVCGKYFEKRIDYIIGMGIVGSNVILNIFADNDRDFNGNKKNNEDTSIEYYRRILKKYSFVFGEVSVYYNLKYKDCGTIKDNISLKRYKI